MRKTAEKIPRLENCGGKLGINVTPLKRVGGGGGVAAASIFGGGGHYIVIQHMETASEFFKLISYEGKIRSHPERCVNEKSRGDGVIERVLGLPLKLITVLHFFIRNSFLFF